MGTICPCPGRVRLQAEVSKISGRAAAEQEFREAYLNSKLARQWAGGAAWAAMDFVGVPLTHAAAAAHHATYQQVLHAGPTLHPHCL